MQKTVFITGCSQGIGKEIALYHLKKGDSVYGISRKNDQELAQYAQFFHQSIDLSISEEIVNLLNQFSDLQKVKRIDILYLNAGLIKDIHAIHTLSMSDFNYIMSVNLYAYKILLDYFLDKENLALNKVVVSGSIAGVRPRAGMSAYAISKAALNMMIKLYALEHTNLCFVLAGLCIFDSSVSQVCSRQNPKLKEFPELQKLSIRMESENYLVSAQQRAHELIHIVENFNALEIESGEFFEVRHVLNQLI